MYDWSSSWAEPNNFRRFKVIRCVMMAAYILAYPSRYPAIRESRQATLGRIGNRECADTKSYDRAPHENA